MFRNILISLAAACLCLVSATTVFAQGAPAAGQPVVTVLDAGAEPRRELRYQFDEGSSEKASMDLNIKMSMSMAGVPIPQINMPTIRILIGLDPIDVSDGGTARYEFDISSAELIENADTDPSIAGAVQESLGQMSGTSGWSRIDSRGTILERDLELPSGDDDQLSRVLDSAEQSLEQMSVPLPAEPVGVGAKWRVTQETESGGFSVTQTAIYSLNSIEGNDLSLGVTLTQTASAQDVEMDGLPPGIETTLDSLDSTGTRTIQTNLNRLVPESKTTLSMTIALGFSAQGQTQQIAMNLETIQAIAPAE